VSISWTTIRIPKDLFQKIKTLKERLGESANWKVVLRAVELLDATIRKPKEKKKLPRLDKCSWYIYKFVRSISEFLILQDTQSLQRVEERIAELRERVFNGENEYLNLLVKLLEQYKSTRSESKKRSILIEINETAKMIISDIIVKFMFEEEESKP